MTNSRKITSIIYFQQSIASPSPAEAGDGAQVVIWGTDVVVSECKSKFKRFIVRFIDPETDLDERSEGIDPEEPLYLQKLKEVGFCCFIGQSHLECEKTDNLLDDNGYWLLNNAKK